MFLIFLTAEFFEAAAISLVVSGEGSGRLPVFFCEPPGGRGARYELRSAREWPALALPLTRGLRGARGEVAEACSMRAASLWKSLS